MSDKREKATLEDLANVTESLKEQGLMPKIRMVDFIEIPERATNGDMIKAMFPNAKKHESTEYHNILFAPSCHLECCNEDWWNSPYRKEQE